MTKHRRNFFMKIALGVVFTMALLPSTGRADEAPALPPVTKTVVSKQCNGATVVLNEQIEIGGDNGTWQSLQHAPSLEETDSNDFDRSLFKGPDGTVISIPLSTVPGEGATHIEVTRYRPPGGGHAIPDSAPVLDEVCHVWGGQIRGASRSPNWDEAYQWNLEATLLLQSGNAITMLTDGTHVQLQDPKGAYWFTRIEQ